MAVAHLVVEFLGFVGLQLLSIGQFGGNALAAGAGFRVQHSLTVFGAAGEGSNSQQQLSQTATGRFWAHICTNPKKSSVSSVSACVECGGRNAAFFVAGGPFVAGLDVDVIL